ncbi:MAG TPA: hypothetical protein VFH95_02940 [Candidatus Kapabacteria bacterium]|nr:hypothetical protein [Candidatus Kapabacteria bacterium]
MNKLKTLTTLVGVWSFLLLIPFVARAQKAPFTVTDIHRQMISKAELATMEAAEAKPMMTADGKGIVLMGGATPILVRTGPGDDNESYRIHGIRNPALVLRSGTAVRILFVNVDGDLPHDIRMGNVKPPDTSGTAGSIHLERARDDNYSAEEFSLHALEPGQDIYFCSVHSHAKNGMQGRMVVLKSDATMREMMEAK